MPKTTFSQKIGLLFLGLFLAAVFLELGLRVAGNVYLAVQNDRNDKTRVHSKKNGRVYKILCLGESTTAFGGQDSYPSQMEKFLNQSGEPKFVVINKGVPATTTDMIAAKLESYLNEYKPDMVAAMIGVNDVIDTPVFQSYSGGQRHGSVVELKIVKLLRMLKEHLQQKRKDIERDAADQKALKAAQDEVIKNPSSDGFFKLAKLYAEQKRFQEQKETLDRALGLSPQDLRVYIHLAEYYENAEDFQEAEAQYLRALRLPVVPGLFKLALMSGLAQCYSQEKKYAQAEAIYINLLKNISGRIDDQILFYDLLTELYMDEGKYAEAVDAFVRRTALKPTGIAMYMKISYAYRKLQRFDDLEKVLRRGLAIHPPETQHYLFLYSELGYCLIEHKKYSEAQAVFKEMSAMNSKQQNEIRIDIRHGFELAEKGVRGEAVNLERETYPQDQVYYLSSTAANYRRIRDIAAGRGIKLIAVQYPMRPVAPLKQLLGEDPRVLYVDNEGVFKKAVAGAEYSKYFVDHFGGDFGHCTVEGNAILAKQVAAIILEAVR